MRFSTFSTGFSTGKSGFAYTSRNVARRFMPVSGKKSGHFAFYIKESRRIFFSFYSSFRLTIRSLSRLEKRSPEFSTERERRFFVWKKRGKLRFSTVCRRSPAESAPHAVFAPECVRNRAIACVPSCSVPSKKLPPSRWYEPQKLDKKRIKRPQRSESCIAQGSGRLVLIWFGDCCNSRCNR